MYQIDSVQQQSGFDQIVGWSNIFSALVAAVVVVLSIWVAGAPYQTLALMSRRFRAIGPAVHKADMSKSWLHFASASRKLLWDRVRGVDPQVRDELIWLSELRPATSIETELPAPAPVPIPFTFAEYITADGYGATLSRLADAYESYASAVRRRWLLRSAAGPLVEQEYQCAKSTADLLRRWAAFEPMVSHEDPDLMRGRVVQLDPQGRAQSVRLIAWPDMAGSRASSVFPVLGISYQPYRVVMDGSPARNARPDPKEVRVVANVLPALASNPLNFDGVLPRWHGPGFRIEVDRVTGRQKLHLCIAETTYFAFRATQVPEAADLAGDAALCARVLTINLLAMDDYDVVVLVRRSDYVVNAGRFTGTVSGNCELVSREGLSADVDPQGLPDLREAIIREAYEELGIDLNPVESQLGTLGVFEVNGATELGTYILVVTARIPGPAAEFRIKRSGPDPIEGLWEIGNKLMTIDLAAALKERAAGHRFIKWLRSCQELTPNAAGSLLLLIIARLELRQQQAARAARNDRPAHLLPWTTSDLVKWLEEPISADAPKPRNVVNFYPLWE